MHPSTLAPDEFVKAFRSHPERLPHMSPPDPEFMARVWPTVERLMGDGADDGFSARLAELPTRTLILFGRDDGIINPINGRMLRRCVAQLVAAIRVRRGARHPVAIGPRRSPMSSATSWNAA